jgi:glycosyltransferase involved in cell wall biosynthesis
MPRPKLISILFPCYNERENILELFNRINFAISNLNEYDFEVVAIDNNSEDGTQDILRELAHKNKSFKVILNTRNFGHVRSPYYGLMQCNGDAIIYLASDLQDPPELIPQFIKEWENGSKIVLATKPESKTSNWTNTVRKAYYRSLNEISNISLINDSTGFGLYDRVVIDQIKAIGDPYPYFRGLICELGYPIKLIRFDQPRRAKGITKNNFLSLYDVAMLGIVSHSKVPLRLASFIGFFMGFMSILSALLFFVLKIIYWDSFPVGVAPIIISLFFLFGIVMIFIGLLGEYIGSIHTYLQKRPIVVERQRINF